MDRPQTSLRVAARSKIEWLAGKLSRVTSTGELIPEVDGMRFIAISAVLFHHLMAMFLSDSGRSPEVRGYSDWFAAADQSWLVTPAYCGHFGVNLFFVISGFILALPFAKRAFNGQAAPNLKSYYLRRVTRIEPPYLLSLIAIFLIHWKQWGEGPRLIPNLIASLFYSHGLVYGRESAINGVAWSLEIEIQFYLLTPLLVRLFRLRNVAARRSMIVALIVGFGLLSQWVIYPSGSARLPLTLLNFAHYFLTGFLLVDLYLTGRLRGADKRLAYDLLTLAGAAAIFATLSRFGQFYFLLPMMVGLLYAGFFMGRLSNAFARARWITIIGGRCYTIYLYHTLIISNMMSQTMPLASIARPFNLDFALQCLMILPMVLAVCALLFFYAEKPFMRWSLSPRQTKTLRVAQVPVGD
ncbi:MAG TPA: acyltransferase [Blastocatellia bacterium]|nr:acyltransferase [Blastocatellia bacterium]